MNRIATISACTGGMLLLLVAYRASRPSHKAVDFPSAEGDSETAEVMPAVSDAWSKLNAPTSTIPRLRGKNLIVSAETNADVDADSNNALNLPLAPEAIGTRVKDLVAHLALEAVGLDPDADQYWLAAINDPNLPAEERHDLIEGLSEAGFDDPGHVTSDDLPLIVSRIALVEELSQHALDSANAAAFQQTYRDLLNMFASASESGMANTPSTGVE